MSDTSKETSADLLLRYAVKHQWTPQLFAREFAMGSLMAGGTQDPSSIERKATMLATISDALRGEAVRNLTERDFNGARAKIASEAPAPAKERDLRSYHNEYFRGNAQDLMNQLLASDQPLATSLAKAALETTNWSSANERIPTVRLFDGLAEAFADSELQAAIAQKRIDQQKIAKETLDSQLTAWIDRHLNTEGDMPDNLFTKACYLANWATSLTKAAYRNDLTLPNLPAHAPEGVRMPSLNSVKLFYPI